MGLISGSSSDSDDDNPYIHGSRLINGVETQFKLPIPLTILKDKFFECLTKKPDDFDETNFIHFKAGF